MPCETRELPLPSDYETNTSEFAPEWVILFSADVLDSDLPSVEKAGRS